MTTDALIDLGWSEHFAAEVADGEGPIARITSVHRSRAEAVGPDGPMTLAPGDTPLVVGDWVVVADDSVARVLPRRTVLARRAAGAESAAQLIAANVDTLAIVSSCNADFNVARIERYLAMALQAGCTPVIVLTKADECDDPDDFARRAAAISPLAQAIVVNAKAAEDVRQLDALCGPGQTLALAGMSGVGKTTIRNALTGEEALTAGIRADDARGRHTTTSRQMRRTLAGGWLIDTPGMRELGLAEASAGIGELFADIQALTEACKFRDCAHESEPGCAVTAAVAAGALDKERLERWRKLKREEQVYTAGVAETRSRQKGQQRIYNEGTNRGRAKRGDSGRR